MGIIYPSKVYTPNVSGLTGLWLAALCCLISHFGLATASAQANAHEQALFERTVTIYTDRVIDLEEFFYFESPENPAPLKLYRSQRNIPFQFRGYDTFHILKRKRESPEGQWVYYPVASTTLPAKEKEVLLIFSDLNPALDQNEFQLGAMPSMRSGIPSGSLAFYNGSSLNMIGILGDRPLSISPGWNQPINLASLDNGEHIRIGLAVRHQDNEHIVLNNQIRFQPNRRTLIVLMPPANPSSNNLYAFRLIERAE